MMFSFRENTLRASRPCRTASRGLHSLSGRPSGFSVHRIVGKGNLWITEYVIIYEGKRVYTVSIMEFRDGKVSHETQYFADPFNAPAWRAQWVETVPVDNI